MTGPLRQIGACRALPQTSGDLTLRTLQSIAHNLYGTWKAAKEIGHLNGIHDTLRKLPAGTKLKLP